ncbi:MAG: Hpt domain-containing protein, partial [Spirochaetota bacterium]|nr:Hpt domain-containing protein [Spirochaetota bacterium]
MSHDYKDVFVEEAREQVDLLNDRLLEIENDPDNPAYINDIFRVAHTLKSSAAFVGLQDLSDFAHKVESLLQKIRDREIRLTTELVDFLFKSLDKIRHCVDVFSESDTIVTDFEGLLGELERASMSEGSPVQSAIQSAPDSIPSSDESPGITIDRNMLSKAEQSIISGEGLFHIVVFFEDDVKMKWVRAELVYVNIERMGEIIHSMPLPSEFKSDKLNEKIEVILASSTVTSDVIKVQLNLDLIREVRAKELSVNDLKALLLEEQTEATKQESLSPTIDEVLTTYDNQEEEEPEEEKRIYEDRRVDASVTPDTERRAGQDRRDTTKSESGVE